MSKPNCASQTGPDVRAIDFGRHKIEGCFDGGSMSSDAGVMLLAVLICVLIERLRALALRGIELAHA